MIQNKKMLPIGVEDFEKLIKENYYYVDKTGLIIDLLKNRGEVNLFTRPRRFGKSLNMKMLEAFFSPATDKRVFDGLKVSEEKELCDKYMGKFPVIALSFSEIYAADYNDAYNSTVLLIRDAACKIYNEVLHSEKITSRDRDDLLDLSKSDIPESLLCRSLLIMSGILERHYGRKTVILIDEYDVPLAKAYEHGYYERMVIMIRKLFQCALKGNSSLFFAVLSGCLRISKESIFTGLNNLKVYSVFSARFDEYFGFTDNEVREMLEYYDLSANYGSVREWYDGYRFGEENVYCPWDVINYCDDLLEDSTIAPQSYWRNSSSNSVVRAFLERSENNTVLREEIEKLINGGVVSKVIRQDLTYQDMYSTLNNVWSLLYMTGYLTQQGKSDGKTFHLTIPNEEVRCIFKEQFIEFFKENVVRDGETFSLFCSALQKGDAATVERIFTDYLKRTISIRDFGSKDDMKENFYHGVLLGILGVKENWGIFSNRESGNGYYDILVSIGNYETAILIEVKYAPEGRLETACRAALEQIEKKQYAEAIKDKGFKKVIKFGIACYKKMCMVMLANG